MLSKLRLFLAAFLLMAASMAANATVFTFIPSDADLDDLDHYTSYRWGIKNTALYNELNSGKVITAATLTITKIYNWAVEPNILYVALLNNVQNGLATIYDNQGGGNQFASAVQIGTHTDPYGDDPTKAINLTFNFNSTLLSVLTNYIKDGLGGSSNGHFGLGFDPDCHFYNTGVCFTVTTGNAPPQDPSVPEPATMSMLGLGLAGMVAARRRKRARQLTA